MKAILRLQTSCKLRAVPNLIFELEQPFPLVKGRSVSP